MDSDLVLVVVRSTLWRSVNAEWLHGRASAVHVSEFEVFASKAIGDTGEFLLFREVDEMCCTECLSYLCRVWQHRE